MPALLNLVSRTLRTLTVLVSPTPGRLPPSGLPFRDVFPRLEELTIAGDIAFVLGPMKCSDTENEHRDPWSRVPVLRRLHYIPYNHRSADIVITLTNAPPPFLTHVRFSGIVDLQPDVLSRMIGLANIDVSQSGSGASGLRAASSGTHNKATRIQYFMIHIYPRSFRCGTGARQWKTKCSEMLALAIRCRAETGIEMRFVVGSQRQEEIEWGNVLQDNWLDCIEGRSGCWNRSRSEVGDGEDEEAWIRKSACR